MNQSDLQAIKDRIEATHADSKVKKCKRCQEIKSVSCFYWAVKNLHYSPRCRPCHNINLKETRNPVLRGISEAIHAQTRPKRKYDKSLRPKLLVYQRQWKKNNPHKVIAHQIVGRAIKEGTLKRPQKCEVCQKDGRIEASHTDYSRPLDVQWLCPKCHRRKDIGKWIHLLPALV